MTCLSMHAKVKAVILTSGHLTQRYQNDAIDEVYDVVGDGKRRLAELAAAHAALRKDQRYNVPCHHFHQETGTITQLPSCDSWWPSPFQGKEVWRC